MTIEKTALGRAGAPPAAAFRNALAGLALGSLMALSPIAHQAVAIEHGCTPPRDIDDISIDILLDGKRSQASGPFCDAVAQASGIIALAQVSQLRADGARQVLHNLQELVAGRGQSAAGGRVTGSAGCSGGASTGSNGSSASGGCYIQINF